MSVSSARNDGGDQVNKETSEARRARKAKEAAAALTGVQVCRGRSPGEKERRGSAVQVSGASDKAKLG